MKKKDHKILLLAAVGAGAYLLYRNTAASAPNLATASAGLTPVPAAPVVQTLAPADFSSTLTTGQIQNNISQVYADDASNLAKISAWMKKEPNVAVRQQQAAWVNTTDKNQRSFLANYYDYTQSGYNHDLLLAGTIPFMNEVDRLKASTGFHL
jgi:hypothetical protein